MNFVDQILLGFDNKAHLQRRISQYSRVVFAALILAIAQYLWLGFYPVAGLLAFAALAMLVCDGANRRGYFGGSILLFLGVCWIVLLRLMWIGGGLQDTVVLTLPILLMIAGQFLRPRYFVAFTVLLVLGVGGVGLATLQGWRTAVFVDTDFNRFTDSVLILSAAGVLVWFVTRDVQMALRKLRDVIERHEASEKNLTYLAQHDTLTRLPNRRLGTELMVQAMASARRHEEPVALFFVDLDNFKAINDSLGHAAGDEFLLMVAQRLRTALRADDILCRQGGDEFLVGLPRTLHKEAISQVAASLLRRFSAPFVLQGTEVLPTCSIGIAIFPQDGDTFEELLRRADLAMYQSKKAGRNAYRFFGPEMEGKPGGSLDVITGLRQSVRRGELVLNYQPVYSLATGRLTGAEALVRWISPAMGRVAPNDFIPAAETSGLIVDIGQWVLEEACRQMQTWHAAGYDDLSIAVNLSPVQFQRGNLEAVIERALARSWLAPQWLELEVTESTLVQDPEAFSQTLNRIKALGVKIAIDDFGTGYSNLSQLQRFAIDRLKIDQSFVRDLSKREQSKTLVTAIVQMARGLGLAITAEGVEDAATRDVLAGLGVDQVQGYYFAKPMTTDEFGALLQMGLSGRG